MADVTAMDNNTVKLSTVLDKVITAKRGDKIIIEQGALYARAKIKNI